MRKPLIASAALLSLAVCGVLAATLPAWATLPARPDEKDIARAKEQLAPFAGNWDTEITMAGMPPSKGSEVVQALPHGLALVVTSTASMGPMGAYEGHGLMGYDSKTGKWMHVWTDNAGSTFSVSEGRFSEDGKSFIIEGEQDMGTGPLPVVMTMHVDDADHLTWTMRNKDGAADAAALMTMKYTRKR